MPNEHDIFTVGHSTHALPELVALLRANGVRRLVDVRAYPRSRRAPQFNSDALAESLPREGIDYVHMRELGGRRAPAPNSPNTGWRSDQFRGYADHMRSPEFSRALARLVELADERSTAIMCAEALWFRCHRRLVADALAARGHRVLHIGSDGRTVEHELTPFAVVEAEGVTYPARADGPGRLTQDEQ